MFVLGNAQTSGINFSFGIVSTMFNDSSSKVAASVWISKDRQGAGSNSSDVSGIGFGFDRLLLGDVRSPSGGVASRTKTRIYRKTAQNWSGAAELENKRPLLCTRWRLYDGNIANGTQTGLTGPQFNGYYFNTWEAGAA